MNTISIDCEGNIWIVRGGVASSGSISTLGRISATVSAENLLVRGDGSVLAEVLSPQRLQEGPQVLVHPLLVN